MVITLGQAKLQETIIIVKDSINKLEKKLAKYKELRNRHVGKGKTILWDGRGKQAPRAWTKQHFRGNLPGACRRGKYTERAWSIPFEKKGHKGITLEMTLHQNADGGNRCSIGRFRVNNKTSRCMLGGERHGEGHFKFRRSASIDISDLSNKKYNIIIEWAAIKTGCCDSGYVRGPSDPIIYYNAKDVADYYDNKVKALQPEISKLKNELLALQKIKKEEIIPPRIEEKPIEKPIKKKLKKIKKAKLIPELPKINLRLILPIVGIVAYMIARRR